MGPAHAIEMNRRGVLTGLTTVALRPRMGTSNLVGSLSRWDAGHRALMWRSNFLVRTVLRQSGLPDTEESYRQFIALERTLSKVLDASPALVENFFNVTLQIHPHQPDSQLPLAAVADRIVAAVKELSPALAERLHQAIQYQRFRDANYPVGDLIDWRHRIWATPKMHAAVLDSDLATGTWDPAFGLAERNLVKSLDEIERRLANEWGLPLEVVWEHAFFLDVDRGHYVRKFVESEAVTRRLLADVHRLLPKFAERLVRFENEELRHVEVAARRKSRLTTTLFEIVGRELLSSPTSAVD